MKITNLIAIAAACFLLQSCADFKFAGLSIETPYGTINTDKNGSTTVILKPIVIDEK